ncbi:MAG: DUF4957 domain-containing protein [Pedobacter sp.]|nr:DUF4957 domain-containing protein [Pedobacter sp.]
MKILLYKMGVRLLLLFAFMVLINACKKEAEILPAPRLFKASEINIAAGTTSAKLKWAIPLFSLGKAIKYTVDFSKDQAFTAIAFTKVVDTAGITVTDDNLTTRTPYFVRIKANAYEDQPESKYVLGANSFSLTGVQLFLPVRDAEIRETSVTIRYVPATDLTAIKLTPATGTATTVALTAADAAAGLKVISGLSGGIKYDADLLAGTKSKGIISFTTLAVTTYTVKISPIDDLAATIVAAANGAVIGLDPGTYNLTAVNTFIIQKSITLKSTSGTPTDTKVNFKEIDIEGTGAGITLSGIELDGTAATSLYFINFIGSQASNSAAATFTNIIVDNCIVHGATTSFMRADRGAAARDFKIGNITVNNSIVYDMGSNGSSAYYTFHLNKMEFNALNIFKSTFYNSGPGLITASTTYSGNAIPSVNISYSTFNGFGGNAKYALLDANANQVNFSLTNSILANTPKSGTVVAAIRSSGAGITTTFSYNNTFNLYNALTGNVALTFPATVTQTANQTIDLGWVANTVDFTLPLASTLRTASNTATAIGDPRWTY